jgi:acetoin utilization deacetylase AcuC-like enzyme
LDDEKVTRTALVFTPKYYEHKTGIGHPESPKRLRTVIKHLEESNLLSSAGNCELVEPALASEEDLELVHTKEHIHLVKRACEHGGGLLDLGDTIASPESFEVARLAVGGAKKAVDLVLTKKFKNAFALVRPPGHHAGPYYAMGFCIFNNVAVAAAHLITRLGFDRVAILDVDAHHGNGTQEIFYKTDKVLYVSMHEDPRDFPESGFADEVGAGKGMGYTVNIPLPFKAGDKEYFQALDQIVLPIIRQYAPQFLLASVGYDAYRLDPVAKLGLSAFAYASAFEKILGLASAFCEDRFVAVLEGGYSLRHLGRLVASTISKMANLPYVMEYRDPCSRLPGERTRKKAEKILKEVKNTQSSFWNL